MITNQDRIYQYFERNPELRVLFIFNEGLFLAEELNGVTWRKGYRYVEFKGDWFTTKVRLDTEWKDEKVVMYFNMPSPFTQPPKDKEKFLLMDVLTANMEFRHQDYAAYMQQYKLPEGMSEFVQQNIALLQNEKILRMLMPSYQDGSVNEDTAARAILSYFMGKTHILSWHEIIVHFIIIFGRKNESKQLQAKILPKLLRAKIVNALLERKLKEICGCSYEVNSEEKVARIVKTLKYNAIVQNLSPVDADDYQCFRISDTVALQQINSLLELAMREPTTALAMTKVMEDLGSEIREENIIRWYGAEASYNFIPDKLCMLILRELIERKIDKEPTRVISSIEELKRNKGKDDEIAAVMNYAATVAHFYEKASAFSHITLKLNSADEYVTVYTTNFYEIDQLYRHAVGYYYMTSPTSELFESVQSTKQTLDEYYAKLINRLNLEWTRCLKDTNGFSTLQVKRQQDFYDRQIKPIEKKVAVIVSDALRYEVAQELMEKLAESRHTAEIEPAIAMLPTETKYCKPSLLPHQTLQLYGEKDIQNMAVDNKILGTIEERNNHIASYKEGAICVRYEDVAKYIQKENRETFKHQLVYIFHDDIDRSGHDDSAQNITAACETAIANLSKLITTILATYNVTEVYVTADHGFLFNDMAFADKDKQIVDENVLERKSRYYLTYDGTYKQGIVKFPLNEVSGMNARNIYVAVPEGTNRLAAPSGGYMFAHGGASLQEMIIPVIKCRQRRDDIKQKVGVTLLANNLSVVASRLKFNLLQTEAVSMDKKERRITVALYYNEQAVTKVKEYVLNKTDRSLDKRIIQVDLTLNRNTDAKMFQLKVYDKSDSMNPLIKENVTNNTLIENDFDF